MSDKEIKKIINYGARRVARKLAGLNIEMSLADIKSHLGLVYARAIKHYRPKIDGDNTATASLATYLVVSFMRDYKTMMREVKVVNDLTRYQIDSYEQIDPVSNYDIEYRDLVYDLLNGESESFRLIIGELVNPSDAVVSATKNICSQDCETKKNTIEVACKALAEVHGVSSMSVRYQIGKAKEKANILGLCCLHQ